MATTNTALVTLSNQLAQRFGLTSDPALLETLKATAFKSKDPVSDAQMTALLVIANQYGLNPWTREIYAYPDERKGIVPVVGVDGWIRIVNEHPMFDGWEFHDDAETGAMTCSIYRKDRSRPTTLTEYFDECKRNTDPWKNMPRRMMRHKALMQCARVAFGFALYDDEEAQAAIGLDTIDAATGEVTRRGPQRKSAATPMVDEVPKSEQAPKTDEPARPATSTSDKPTAPPANPANTSGISGGQVAYLRNKIKAAELAESTFCDRFQVASLELLTAEAFDTIKAELLAMA